MKIYCSGIGGIGLSAYASLQKAAGHEVLGSDRSDSALLDDLRSQGITIFLDQSGTAVPEGCDLFVYSEAIPASAPERKRAAAFGIPQQSYPQAVGELSRPYDLIAICGTHGKSSTTAMVSRLLLQSGKDPTVVVGTKLQELHGRNWVWGKSKLFVLEACEYRHSFLNYEPSYALLTTCDGDHFDFYTSQEDYEQSFIKFLSQMKSGGAIITHLSDPICRRVAEASGKRIIDADEQPLLQLNTPGLHMRQNAQLVLALAKELTMNAKESQKILSGYSGSWRRMEVKGMYQGGAQKGVKDVTVIDDYAHHPAEIRATMQGVREANPRKRLVCIFQPHTHDRILKLYDDFLGAFAQCDLVIVADVYEARKEIETAKIDLPTLAADIQEKSAVPVEIGGPLSAIEATLPSLLRSGDVLLCMGAGDSTNLAEKLTRAS